MDSWFSNVPHLANVLDNLGNSSKRLSIKLESGTISFGSTSFHPGRLICANVLSQLKISFPTHLFAGRAAFAFLPFAVLPDVLCFICPGRFLLFFPEFRDLLVHLWCVAYADPRRRPVAATGRLTSVPRTFLWVACSLCWAFLCCILTSLLLGAIPP